MRITFTGENISDTGIYFLPEDTYEYQVVRAVTGIVDQESLQDFEIDWKWDFDLDEDQDIVDTEIGDDTMLKEADQLTVGFHIMVSDDGPTVKAEDKTYVFAETGDSFDGRYMILLLITSLVLIILIDEKRRNSNG